VLVMELFESKLRQYNENTVDVWVKYLSNIDLECLRRSIENLIMGDDEFISIGKVIKKSNEAKQWIKLEQEKKRREEPYDQFIERLSNEGNVKKVCIM